MAQNSYFWNDNGVGDGQAYSFNDWTDLWGLLFSKNRITMSVIGDYLNELEVSDNGVQIVQIDTGGALVDGKLYINPVAFDIAALGAGATGQIIVRKITASGTVRVVNKAIGALTQTTAVWENQLATWSTDGGGNVTVVDTRVFIVSPLADTFNAGDTGVELIETIEGDGSSATIDFTAIPATYDHLLIQGVGRLANAAVTANLQVILNNDAGANYNDNNIKGNNNVLSGDENQTQNEIFIGQICAATATANRFSSSKIWIPYYKETDFFKALVYKGLTIPNDAVAATWENILGSGNWLSAVAINRVTLLNSAGGNFVTGTSYSLYGIKE